MYALYEKIIGKNIERYKFIEQISLFGCNSGYIPWLLRSKIFKSQSEPLRWHLNIYDSLTANGKYNCSLIINLKPKNSSPNLSLYELVDVWGYSESGWTPIMMRLRALFVDDDPTFYDEHNFERNIDDIDDPIFSMMYLAGSINNGQLTGRWTAPGASPTNSVLLWPNTFEYFANEAKIIMQNFKN